MGSDYIRYSCSISSVLARGYEGWSFCVFFSETYLLFFFLSVIMQVVDSQHCLSPFYIRCKRPSTLVTVPFISSGTKKVASSPSATARRTRSSNAIREFRIQDPIWGLIRSWSDRKHGSEWKTPDLNFLPHSQGTPSTIRLFRQVEGFRSRKLMGEPSVLNIS